MEISHSFIYLLIFFCFVLFFVFCCFVLFCLISLFCLVFCVLFCFLFYSHFILFGFVSFLMFCFIVFNFFVLFVVVLSCFCFILFCFFVLQPLQQKLATVSCKLSCKFSIDCLRINLHIYFAQICAKTIHVQINNTLSGRNLFLENSFHYMSGCLWSDLLIKNMYAEALLKITR